MEGLGDTKRLRLDIGNDKAELEINEILGQGAFGTVYRAVDAEGKSFALKVSECRNVEAYYTIAQELQILLPLADPNICKMYAFDFHEKKAILVMEFCDGGNLNKRLQNPVDRDQQVAWAHQLIGALSFLHHKDIVHRDLKPENILLRGSQECIKVSDFGISRYYYAINKGQFDPRVEHLSEYLEQYMGTFAGTPYWISPEVFEHKYTELADIFSLGVIINAIVNRQFIVYDGNKYYGAFVNYKGKNVGIGIAMYEQQKAIHPEFDNPDGCPELFEIADKFLAFQPKDRMSLSEANKMVQLIIPFTTVQSKKSSEEGEHSKVKAFWRSTDVRTACFVLTVTLVFLGYHFNLKKYFIN